jgi:hypothetical protein
MRIVRYARLIALVAACHVVGAVSSAHSANIVAIPQLTLQERWDSNIENASDNALSDYVLRVAPRLTLALDTPDFRLGLMGGIDYQRYSSHDEFNGKAATVFGLNSTGPLRFSPRFSVTPTIRYVETNDAVRRNELTASTISGLPASESIVTVPTKVREVSGFLQVIYLVSPNVDFSMGGGGTKRTNIDNSTTVVDSRTLSGNTSLAYRFSPRHSSGLFISTSYNTFSNDTDSRTYGGGLTTAYAFSETISLNGKLGISYVRENLEAGEKGIYRSPSATLSMTYKERNFQTYLEGSYDISGSGSFGFTTRRGNVLLRLTEQFTDKWMGNLSGAWQNNKSIDPRQTDLDISTSSLSAGIRYQPSTWASISLSGSLTRQRSSEGFTNLDIDRKHVLLDLDLSTNYRLF